MAFEHFICRRYLRVRQGQSFVSLITLLSVFGVTVGVMALIVVIAVMEGFEKDIKSRILGIEPHLVIKKKGRFVEYEQVVEIAAAEAEVVSAQPVVAAQVMLRSSSKIAGAILKGISASATHEKSIAAGLQQLESIGDENKADDRVSPAVPGIVLGRELARALGVLKGDLIHIVSPRGMIGPTGHIPSMKRFQVVGYFHTGMYQYDGAYAFIRLNDAQRLLRMRHAASSVEIKLKNLYKAPKIGQRIKSKLNDAYIAQGWMDVNKNLFSALKLEKTAMFIILALIILVAALNIAGSLIMMVIDKTKDIAILKAMGATSKTIGNIFVLKGMVVGTAGILIGSISGVGLCYLLEKYQFVQLPGDVYYITTLPVELAALDVALIALAALLICFLATLYPARKASSMSPVDAIRYG